MSQDDERKSLAHKPSQKPTWYVVATTFGLTEASIIAGRLQSLGIPTTIHREAAGAALGLSIGRLGQAQVLVPEKYYDFAMATLEPDESLLTLDDGDEVDEVDTD